MLVQRVAIGNDSNQQEIIIPVINNSLNEPPEYATQGASGMDIKANIVDNLEIQLGDILPIPTGISLEIPVGYEIQIRLRTSELTLLSPDRAGRNVVELQGGDGGGGDAGNISPGVRRNHVYRAILVFKEVRVRYRCYS